MWMKKRASIERPPKDEDMGPGYAAELLAPYFLYGGIVCLLLGGLGTLVIRYA